MFKKCTCSLNPKELSCGFNLSFLLRKLWFTCALPSHMTELTNERRATKKLASLLSPFLTVPILSSQRPSFSSYEWTCDMTRIVRFSWPFTPSWHKIEEHVRYRMGCMHRSQGCKTHYFISSIRISKFLCPFFSKDCSPSVVQQFLSSTNFVGEGRLGFSSLVKTAKP